MSKKPFSIHLSDDGREKLKELYPNSLQVKAGFPPNADLDPWVHTEQPLSPEWLAQVGEELEDPMAESEGHKKTLRACRRLYDEVMFHRATLQMFITGGYPNVRIWNSETIPEEEAMKLAPGHTLMDRAEAVVRRRYPQLFEGPFEKE